MKMKAFMFYQPRDIRMELVDVPWINDEEVLVRIKVALTCGTDLKTYNRGHPLLMKTLPSPFGHEFAGVVEEVGKDVERFIPGMNVVAANTAPCNSCFYCKINRLNLCENLEFLNGAYAEFIKIPERIVKQNLLPIPDHVSFRQAALCEPLACVLHGLDAANIRPGDTIVIIGAGPIGLMFVRLAKLRNAQVIVVGRNESKLERAKLLGADEIISIYNVSDPEKAVRDLTPDARGADVVIEAVGLPEIWGRAVDAARKGGVIMFFGGCESGTSVTIDTKKIHYDEKKILGVFHHTPQYIAEALKLISEGQIDDTLLITHDCPLSELERGFQLIEQRQALKVAIYP